MPITYNQTLDQLVPQNSTYLTQADIPEEGLLLTVLHFANKEIEGDQGKEPKILVYFNEVEKALVLNRTNAQLLAKFCGTTVGAALGKQVIVYVDPSISYGGKVTGGIRIRAAVVAQPKRPTPAEAPGRDPLNRRPAPVEPPLAAPFEHPDLFPEE